MRKKEHSIICEFIEDFGRFKIGERYDVHGLLSSDGYVILLINAIRFNIKKRLVKLLRVCSKCKELKEQKDFTTIRSSRKKAFCDNCFSVNTKEESYFKDKRFIELCIETSNNPKKDRISQIHRNYFTNSLYDANYESKKRKQDVDDWVMRNR